MEYCDRPDVVVILAAGLGSRLQNEAQTPKPLMPVLGKPLLMRVASQFIDAGIREVVVVLGHRADEIKQAILNAQFPCKVTFAINPKYHLNNGLSVLAARSCVGNRPFFLSMSDHIFETELIHGLKAAKVPTRGLKLAVDRKLDTIFDMDDATKVHSDKERIINIGKNIEKYDAIDTGLFYCAPELFDAIQHKAATRDNGDCTLSEGLEALMAQDLALVHDIGETLWQDVDTPESLKHAEKIFG